MDDKLLFVEIKQNNQKALELLFQKYYTVLCTIAKAIVNSRDLADEIVSDVFLNIWIKRDKLSIDSDFKNYLIKAVKNRSLNYLTREIKSFEDIEKASNYESNKSLQPDHYLSLNETQNFLNSLVNQLPNQQKLIFKLNRIEGLTYKEIAEMLSITVDTVQKHMSKAISFLIKHKDSFYLTTILWNSIFLYY